MTWTGLQRIRTGSSFNLRFAAAAKKYFIGAHFANCREFNSSLKSL